MKKLLLLLMFSLAVFRLSAQNIPPVDGVRLETPQDYRNADSLTMQVARYFLSIPVDQDTNARLHAGAYLVRWMEGTSEFSFSLSQNELKYVQKDVDLLTVYYACLCAFAIQHPAVKDANTVTLNGMKLFVNYIGNEKNHAVITSRLKRLIAADEKGELKSFLKL